MLEIEELEKEWQNYKIKRMRKWAILGLAVAILLGLFLARSSVHETEGKEKNLQRKFDTHQKTEIEKPVKQPLIEKKKLQQNLPDSTLSLTIQLPAEVKHPAAGGQTKEKRARREIQLNPDTLFLSSFSHDGGSNESDEIRYKRAVKEETIPLAPSLGKTGTETVAEPKKAVHISKNPVSGSSLSVQTKTSGNALDYLIKRFNMKRDPKLAAYIAQSFYKKKNYNQTVKWSIMANSMEPSNEESWLLYAKAKVKLGKKQEAINALRIYLNQYSSQKVKSYLHSLEHSL
jgi:hypothetical protein